MRQTSFRCSIFPMTDFATFSRRARAVKLFKPVSGMIVLRHLSYFITMLVAHNMPKVKHYPSSTSPRMLTQDMSPFILPTRYLPPFSQLSEAAPFVLPEASHHAPAACGTAIFEQTEVLTHVTFGLNSQQPNNITVARRNKILQFNRYRTLR